MTLTASSVSEAYSQASCFLSDREYRMFLAPFQYKQLRERKKEERRRGQGAGEEKEGEERRNKAKEEGFDT